MIWQWVTAGAWPFQPERKHAQSHTYLRRMKGREVPEESATSSCMDGSERCSLQWHVFDWFTQDAMNRKCLHSSVLGLNIYRNPVRNMQRYKKIRITHEICFSNYLTHWSSYHSHINNINCFLCDLNSWTHPIQDTSFLEHGQSTNYLKELNQSNTNACVMLFYPCIRKYVSCQRMHASDERCLMRVLTQTGRCSSYPLLALSNLRVRVSSMIRLLISNKIMMI